MLNFLFEDTIEGGFFFVQCYTVDEAYAIIWEEIASCNGVSEEDTFTVDYDYLGSYTDAEAEIMGYDTY